MAKEILRQQSTLTDYDIRDLVAKVSSTAEKIPEREKLRLLLTVEQILLDYQSTFGKEQQISCVWTEEFFRGSRITISSAGRECNPLLMANEEDAEIVEITQRMLNNIGLGTQYQYLRGHNVTTIKLPSKRKLTMLHQIWIAAAMAILTLILLQFVPAESAKIFTDDFVIRVFKKMVSILSTLATPMIFFALLTGIRNIGNVTALGHMGKTVCLRLAKPYLVAAIAIPFACVVTYPPSAEVGNGASVFGNLFQLVLDIIPDDLVTPLQLNNDMQIIVIAVFAGTVLLMMKGETPQFDKLTDELANLVNRMMALACKGLPVLIYFGIIAVSTQMNMERLWDLYRFAMAMFGAWIIITGFVVLLTWRLVGGSLKEIVKPTIPALLINLATSSQMAAYPASEKCCKEDWGVEPKLFDFAFPMGVVLYMPNGAALIAMSAWMMLYLAGIPADISMMVKVSVLSIIIAIAAPPIPGSGLVVLPIMMTGIGIPLEFMPLGVLYITIFGHFLPALNGFCLQLEMLALGKKLGMLKNTNDTA